MSIARYLSKHRRFGIVVALALTLAALLWTSLAWRSPTPVAAQDATPVASPEATIGEAASEQPAGPTQMTVGFYLTSIYCLDQEAGTYYADF